MNLNHLINMVTNQIIRRVVNTVVDRGFRFASRKSAELTKPDPEPQLVRDVTTPAELAKDAQLRRLADQATTTAKMTGRTPL